MNLQHTTRETTETKTPEIPWYKQPEATLSPSLAVQADLFESRAKIRKVGAYLSPSLAVQADLFEPSEAERILARAGALQEIHGQLLTQEQIEVIAAEIGIKPEFVQLAIEQEKEAALSEPVQTLPRERVTTPESMTRRERLRIADASFGAAALYSILVYLILLLAGDHFTSIAPFLALVFVLPALLAFALGVIAKSRRWGTVTGASLAVTVVIAVVACSANDPDYGAGKMSTWDMQALAIMCGTGAFLGAAGAQAQRIVSRRQMSNRSKS